MISNWLMLAQTPSVYANGSARDVAPQILSDLQATDPTGTGRGKHCFPGFTGAAGITRS